MALSHIAGYGEADLEETMSDPVVPSESPAVARRRLRLALRGFRDERHQTQQQVADALEWSLSKIVRIELGDVTISKGDLTELLRHYGIRDDQQVRRLQADARAARQKGQQTGWWAQPSLRPHLTPAMAQLMQFESEATAIRCYQPMLIPGPLQTPRYAEAIYNRWSAELPAETRAARIEIRNRRYAHIFDRESPPMYLLVIDESVILREVGGPAVMAEQLQELIRQIDLRRLAVRVLPLSEGGVVAPIGSFTVMDLEGESALIYRESFLRDEIVQLANEVEIHRRNFDKFWQEAYPEDVGRDLIFARSSDMIASVKRAGVQKRRRSEDASV
jgi:transcriptional regulator with XRE-family HTH domain